MTADILDRIGNYSGDNGHHVNRMIADAADEILRLRARIAHLERAVTEQESSAAYTAFYRGGNASDNAMTLAIAAALKIRIGDAK